MPTPAVKPSPHITARRATPQRDQIRLFSLLLIYLCIAVTYAILIPPGEGVDEMPHFDYVRFVHDQRRLPVNREGQSIEAWMAHHPPLYYALGAPVIAPFDTGDRDEAVVANPHFVWDESGAYGWNVNIVAKAAGDSDALQALYALRLFNVILGAGALFAIYRTVRLLLPDQTWAALAATALIGLNPSFVFMASTVHHDVLLAAIYAAGLFWCVRAALRPLTRAWLIAGAILVAAALLTKLSGATLSLVVAGVILARTARVGDWSPVGDSGRARIVHLLIVGGISSILAGWWPIRNWLLYGDLLAWEMFLRVHGHMARPGPVGLGYILGDLISQLGRTFWGAFGYMHILLPVWMRQVAWALTAVALGGLVFAGLRRGWGRPARSQVVAWGSLIAALLLISLSFVRFAADTVGAGHGRYLFPAGAVIGALLIVGLNGYTGWRHQRLIALAVMAVMPIYAVAAPLRYAWPLYALPASVTAEVDGATTRDLRYEGGVVLAGMRLSDSIVIPGQGLDVITYWAADEDAASEDAASEDAGDFADPYVDLSLVTDDGALLGSALFWPEISTIPATWGERIIENRQSFYIPPGQLSGAVRVEMQIRDGVAGPLLPVQGSGETAVTLAELLALGTVVEIDPSALPAPPREEIFAEVLRLAGSTLPPQVVPGGVLSVELYWQVTASIPADYTVFVHVLDSADQIVAQLDRPPGGGASPTSSWRVGQTLRDTYPVPLPAELPPGDYRVRMGLYTWPDLTRQPVTVAGQPAGDSLILGMFLVAE